MDCNDCPQQLIPYIKGTLDDQTRSAVKSHVDSCDSCRQELEEATWLVNGLTEIRAHIRAGHISSMLLEQYAESPGAVSQATTAFIKAHLADCEHCRALLENAKDLATIRLSPVEVRRRSAWWRFLQPRLVPAYATVLVLIVAATVHFSREGSQPMSAARIVTDAGGYAVHTLSVQRVLKGAPETSGGVVMEIARSQLSSTVLRLEVVTFEEPNVSYRLAIQDSNGEVVWGSPVGTEVLESGAISLVLDEGSFPPGNYTILFIEAYANGSHSITARSQIRIRD